MEIPKRCPISLICGDAVKKNEMLLPGQLATNYDHCYLGFLTTIDKFNHAGEIQTCFECSDGVCVMKQMYPEGTEFREDDPHALRIPSQGNV